MCTVPNLIPILVPIRWFCSCFPLLLCIRIIIGITIEIGPSVAFVDSIGIGIVIIGIGIVIGVGQCKHIHKGPFTLNDSENVAMSLAILL